MSYPNYEDIDPEYRFDLTRIYETPDEWDRAHDRLRDEFDALESRVEEPVTTTAELRDLLERLEECHRRKQRLELYATLSRDVATDDDAAADRRRRYGDLESDFAVALAAAKRRLRETRADRLEDLTADLEDHRRYAENLREQATHVRSTAVEETMGALRDAREAPTEILTTVTAEDFDPGTVERPDGETVDLGYGNYREELSYPDRAYRRRVYDAYWTEMERFEATLTRAYEAKLATARDEATLRNYASIRDRDFRQGCYPESGLQSALPETVHDALLDAVRGNLDPFHRALDVRRERLEVEQLRPWDLDVSIADGDPPTIDYETAKSHILAALEPLGADYVDRVRAVFDGRRIDVFPASEKRTDVPAYCPSSAADGPFVLANFREDVRTTFYLCHELGHALHVEHHREGPTRYATCPRPVEEVPSILHEILLAEHLIAEGGTLADAARNRLLDCLAGNFYRAAMTSAFAHEMATRVEDSAAVTPDRAREAWADLEGQFHAPVAVEGAGRRWLGRGAREPYSRYQYVLGATGALAVRSRLREGELTAEQYRGFLRSTGRESSVALFERLGRDVTAAGPFERAADAIDSYVSEMAV